jgi:hypothetical protein
VYAAESVVSRGREIRMHRTLVVHGSSVRRDGKCSQLTELVAQKAAVRRRDLAARPTCFIDTQVDRTGGP